MMTGNYFKFTCYDIMLLKKFTTYLKCLPRFDKLNVQTAKKKKQYKYIMQKIINRMR